MHTFRRRFLTFISVGMMSAVAWSGSVRAGEYPDRPITLIVQAAAGGASDLAARSLGQKLGETLSVPVVIENVPAAGGIVAAQRVIRSSPDGYTLLVCGSKSAIAESLFKSQPYTLTKDLAVVGVIGSTDLALVVDGKSSPLKNVGDLARKIKAQPGKVTVGVGDTIGGIQYLGAELLKASLQGDFAIVPYGSMSKLVVALHGGEVDAALELVPSIMAQVNQGELRALAATGSQRSEILPNVPTLKESGVQKADVSTMSFVAVPARTPPAVVAKLNDAINRALAQRDYQNSMKKLGINAGAAVNPLDAQRLLVTDVTKWRDVIKTANVPLQ